MDDAAVIRATGRAWSDWYAILDGRGARSLRHASIARLLREEYGVPAWWSQSVTVEYEKHIGRRETGQRESGEFTASASRTVAGTPDEVFERWLALAHDGDGEIALDGVLLEEEPGISRTEKWRYWRARLADGSKATVSVTAKRGGEASVVGVEHGGLRGRAEADRWKAFWRLCLTDL